MWYALIRSYDEYCGDGCHRLFFGSLMQIAQALVDHCSDSVLWEDIGDYELEEFEEDNGDLDSIRIIYENPDPTEEDIRNFDFRYSGERVVVIALTNTFAEFVDAFNAYAEDRFSGEVQMISGNVTDPEVLNRIDSDLVNIYDCSSPYFIWIKEFDPE